jgi:hypothetical protein
MKTIKNMTIIVIAEIPVGDEATTDVAKKDKKWSEFLLNIPETLRKSGTVLRLCENVWQLPLDTGLPILNVFLEYGKSHSGIRMRYLFLEGIPEWQLCPPPI